MCLLDLSHVVHVQLGPKWRDIHTKLFVFIFLQMVNGLAFRLFEHEQYYVLLIYVSVLRFFIISSNLQYLKDNV